MRFVIPALLIMAVALSPVQARADVSPFVFSGFNCRQALPCDTSSPAFPPIADLISMTSSCVNQSTGFSAPNGFFEVAAGLDSNNCLTTRTDAFSGGGEHSIPECCLKPVGNSCYMQCNMVAQ